MCARLLAGWWIWAGLAAGVVLFPAPAWAMVDSGAEGVAGDVFQSEFQLPSPGRDIYQMLDSVPGVDTQPGKGLLAAATTDGNGNDAPSCTLYQVDGTPMFSDLFAGAGYSPPTVQDIQEIHIASRPAALYGNDAVNGVVNVLTRTGDSTAHLYSAHYSSTQGQAYDWGYNQLNGMGSKDFCSLAGGGSSADQSWTSAICSGDQGVHLWDIPSDVNLGGPIIKDRLWFFGTWEKKVINKPVAHAYDSQGNIHGVGVSDDDCLIYTQWNQDLTATMGGQLGECGTYWRWPQVGVGPDDYVWVSAYNATAGNLQIWEKSAGGEWTPTIITPTEGNTVGMHNSMWVDQLTGFAWFTYAFSGSRTKTLKKEPGGSPQWTWLDAAYGQANGTATAACGGDVVHWWTAPHRDGREAETTRLLYRYDSPD